MTELLITFSIQCFIIIIVLRAQCGIFKCLSSNQKRIQLKIIQDCEKEQIIILVINFQLIH